MLSTMLSIFWYMMKHYCNSFFATWTSFLINAKSQTDRSLNNFQVAVVHITSNQATTHCPYSNPHSLSFTYAIGACTSLCELDASKRSLFMLTFSTAISVSLQSLLFAIRSYSDWTKITRDSWNKENPNIIWMRTNKTYREQIDKTIFFSIFGLGFIKYLKFVLAKLNQYFLWLDKVFGINSIAKNHSYLSFKTFKSIIHSSCTAIYENEWSTHTSIQFYNHFFIKMGCT